MMTCDLKPPFDNFEFGICLRDKDGREYFRVPVAKGVRQIFQDALGFTISRLTKQGEIELNDLRQWEPSEKHEAEDPCWMKFDEEILTEIEDLISAESFETNSAVLKDNPGKVFFYFCRFSKGGKHFWGLRKATQFKSSLKTTNAFLGDGELQLASENIFRLDDFFDAIVTYDSVYILRPKDFEYLANLEIQLRSAALRRLREADRSIPFFKLDTLISLVEGGCSMRRARLATAVASREDLAQTDRSLFIEECRRVDIKLSEGSDGRLEADEKNSWAVLHLLDRRRYATTLIPEHREVYEAASREIVD